MTIFQRACGTRRLGHKSVKAPLSQNGKDPTNGRCHSEVNPTPPAGLLVSRVDLTDAAQDGKLLVHLVAVATGRT